jgi:phosphoribosyl-AMP cyclohydrolase
MFMSDLEMLEKADFISAIRFDQDGLVPAIIQDAEDQAVLMLGYMNRESLQITLNSGRVTFWSRSRKKLWTKGETSGNFLNVQEIFTDCDRDTLLIHAQAQGPTCHTGKRSCFSWKLMQ